jgi:hypothetical protein
MKMTAPRWWIHFWKSYSTSANRAARRQFKGRLWLISLIARTWSRRSKNFIWCDFLWSNVTLRMYLDSAMKMSGDGASDDKYEHIWRQTWFIYIYIYVSYIYMWMDNEIKIICPWSEISFVYIYVSYIYVNGQWNQNYLSMVRNRICVSSYVILCVVCFSIYVQATGTQRCQVRRNSVSVTVVLHWCVLIVD